MLNDECLLFPLSLEKYVHLDDTFPPQKKWRKLRDRQSDLVWGVSSTRSSCDLLVTFNNEDRMLPVQRDIDTTAFEQCLESILKRSKSNISSCVSIKDEWTRRSLASWWSRKYCIHLGITSTSKVGHQIVNQNWILAGVQFESGGLQTVSAIVSPLIKYFFKKGISWFFSCLPNTNVKLSLENNFRIFQKR